MFRSRCFACAVLSPPGSCPYKCDKCDPSCDPIGEASSGDSGAVLAIKFYIACKTIRTSCFRSPSHPRCIFSSRFRTLQRTRSLDGKGTKLRRRKEMVDKIQSVRSAKPDERSAPRLHHFPTGWCSASGGHNRRFDFLNISCSGWKHTEENRYKKRKKNLPNRYGSAAIVLAAHHTRKRKAKPF